MNGIAVVRVIAIVCTGLAAGAFLGDRVGVSPARPELSASSFVQLQQIIHGRFVVMMPILLVTSIAASIVWAILLRAGWKTLEFWLVAGGSLAMVFVVAMTRAVNVPINEQLMTWSIQAPPPNVMELWRPWEQVHSIRTLLALAAFAFQVVALSAFAPGDKPAR